MVFIKVLARLQYFFINSANCSLPTAIHQSLPCLTLIELCCGGGKWDYIFFIAGCVLWEICQLELTVPIKVTCFHASCRVLESTRKKGGKASQAIYSDRSGEKQDAKYLGCYLQLWGLPSILLPLCQNTHTYVFPEMCLEKIGGLFPIALLTPYPSHPCEARDCTQAIVWSSTCFHRCEASTSWRKLLRAGVPQVTLWRR